MHLPGDSGSNKSLGAKSMDPSCPASIRTDPPTPQGRPRMVQCRGHRMRQAQEPPAGFPVTSVPRDHEEATRSVQWEDLDRRESRRLTSRAAIVGEFWSQEASGSVLSY